MSNFNPEVFLKAAERVATKWCEEDCKEHHCCCDCIQEFAKGPHYGKSDEALFFGELFMPARADKYGFWFGDTIDSESNRNRRVLALLLAYEIAKG